MKRSALAALAVVGIALTGCAANNDDAVTTEPAAVTEQAPQATAEPVEQEETSLHETPEPTAEEDMHAHPLGSRTEPLGVGEVAPLGAMWDVTLSASEGVPAGQDGDEYLMEDELPAEGEERLIATFEFTFLGQPDDAEAPQEFSMVTFVGESGQTYEAGSYLVPEDREDLSQVGDLYGGASGAGDVAAIVPADEVDGGAWRVEYYDPAAWEPIVAYFASMES